MSAQPLHLFLSLVIGGLGGRCTSSLPLSPLSGFVYACADANKIAPLCIVLAAPQPTRFHPSSLPSLRLAPPPSLLPPSLLLSLCWESAGGALLSLAVWVEYGWSLLRCCRRALGYVDFPSLFVLHLCAGFELVCVCVCEGSSMFGASRIQDWWSAPCTVGVRCSAALRCSVSLALSLSLTTFLSLFALFWWQSQLCPLFASVSSLASVFLRCTRSPLLEERPSHVRRGRREKGWSGVCRGPPHLSLSLSLSLASSARTCVPPLLRLPRSAFFCFKPAQLKRPRLRQLEPTCAREPGDVVHGGLHRRGWRAGERGRRGRRTRRDA